MVDSSDDKVSILQLMAAWKDDITHVVDAAKQELERACDQNAEKIEASFRRIDELKEKHLEMVKAVERTNTIIAERTAAIEKDIGKDSEMLRSTMDERIRDLEKDFAAAKVKIAMASIVASMLLELILRRITGH